MLTRIRIRQALPWIRRPRGIAAAFGLFAVLAASPAYAQRGGGCGGMGGGGVGGSGGAGGAGGAGGVAMGGAGGLGGGMMNPMQMRMMQANLQGQGLFSVPTLQGAYEPPFDHRQYLAARKAFRAAQAERRQQRQAFRQEQQKNSRTTRTVASIR